MRQFNREHAAEVGLTVEGAIEVYLGEHAAIWRRGTPGNIRKRLVKLHGPELLGRPLAGIMAAQLVERAAAQATSGVAGHSLNMQRKYGRAFYAWAAKRGHRRGNPMLDREGDPVLRRMPSRTGADGPKLTEDEAKRFRLTALQAAQAGDDDGVLALACITLGLRSTEYHSPLGRHVDCGGRVLHYQDAKSGKWTHVEVPDATLAGFLVELAARRGQDTPLFPLLPVRGRPLQVVRRFCLLAGVPVVTCQQMRATVDTLGALDLARVTGNRHSVGVAVGHYIGKDTVRAARLMVAAGRLGSETGANLSQEETAAATVEEHSGSQRASA